MRAWRFGTEIPAACSGCGRPTRRRSRSTARTPTCSAPGWWIRGRRTRRISRPSGRPRAGGSRASCSPTPTSDHSEGADALGAPVTLPREGEEIGPVHGARHARPLGRQRVPRGRPRLLHGRHGARHGQRVHLARRGLARPPTCARSSGSAALDLEVLCPGHGPYVWDPRAKLTEYIEHRLDRERRLRRGARRRPPLDRTTCSTPPGRTRRRTCAPPRRCRWRPIWRSSRDEGRLPAGRGDPSSGDGGL